MTLSYNAADSWQSLRWLSVAVAIFLAVAAGLSRVRDFKRLMICLFAVGVAESLLALAQIATDAPGIYWGDIGLGGVRSGSFINHSNFAQLLNLTLGASLSLLLVRASEDRHAARRDRAAGPDAAQFFQRHGWIVIGAGLQATAIAASLSRAGLLAMILSGSLVGVVLKRMGRGGRSAWALLAAVPLVLLVLGWVGFDAVFDRVETLQGEAPLSDRLTLAADTLRAGAAHWLTGSGLGTHASVFPAYDTTGSVAFAEQADNDYAQLFEEMGLLGTAMALGVGLVGLVAAVRTITGSREPMRYAGVGVLYGLVAVAIQSFTDFGMRIPAVYGAAAALAGLCVAIVHQRQEAPVRRPRLALVLLASAFVACVWTGAVVGSVAEYRADRWWAIAYRLDRRIGFADAGADPLDYLDLIAASEEAARLKPDRVKYGFWLNAYRWRAVEFASQGADPLASPEGRASAAAIADGLAACRDLCPTYGPAHTLEGQLRSALGDPEGSGLVAQGARLAPNDPTARFAVAVDLLSAGESAEADSAAFDHLERCVTLDDGYFPDAIELAVRARGAIEFAASLAGEDPLKLRDLARLLEADGYTGAEIDPILERADAAQQRRVEAATAPANEIADLARRRAAAGRHERAVDYYRQALALRFNEVAWRLRLVDSLEALGKLEEAQREAKVCLRLQPKSTAADKRVRELTLKIADAAESTPSRSP